MYLSLQFYLSFQYDISTIIQYRKLSRVHWVYNIRYVQMCPNIEIKCIKKKVCFYFSTNNYKKIAWYLTLIVSNRDFEDVKF